MALRTRRGAQCSTWATSVGEDLFRRSHNGGGLDGPDFTPDASFERRAHTRNPAKVAQCHRSHAARHRTHRHQVSGRAHMLAAAGARQREPHRPQARQAFPCRARASSIFDRKPRLTRAAVSLFMPASAVLNLDSTLWSKHPCAVRAWSDEPGSARRPAEQHGRSAPGPHPS